MRYDQMIAQGHAIKKIPLPIVNIPHGIQAGTPEQLAQWEADGKPVAPIVGIRVIGPGEDVEIDRLADASSRALGVPTYNDTHPICVKERMIYTMATACVDPDSDPRAPLLFFGDTVEQAAAILRDDPKKILTFDTVVYLHEVYEIWKSQTNPQANTVEDHKLEEMAMKAADDADFLALLSPGLRLRFTHILAVLCVQSPELKAMFSLLSSASGKVSLTKPPSPGPVKAHPTKTGRARAASKKRQ